jgi:hypothetical protein
MSRADAQRLDSIEVYEALFSQVESLGLDKDYFVREREGRFPIQQVDYPVPFPDELKIHLSEDFGRINVSLVDESFVSGLWESGCGEGWESFHRRYPDAGELTQISQVLFSESADEAFVYVEQGSGCQSSCGMTYRVLLQDREWIVADRMYGWCS